MKRTLYFCFFSLCSNILYGQAYVDKEEIVVQQLVKDAFEEIWSELDSTKIKEYHTDDFVLLENGEIWNNDSILNYQKKEILTNFDAKRHNKLIFFRVERKRNLVWLAYHNYATWTIGDRIVGEAHWLESAIAIKYESGWKLKLLHSTRVRDN